MTEKETRSKPSRRRQQLLSLALALASTLLFVNSGRSADGGTWIGAIVFTQEPQGSWRPSRDAGPDRIVRPDGCRIAVLEPGKEPWILTGGFSSACDPCVSMDGRSVLFAGKESAGAEWNIFEVGIDGSGLRKITESLGDCLEPEYLARGAINPPDYDEKVRWIVFTSSSPGGLDEIGGGLYSLHVRSLEPVPGRGIVTWRTTHNLSSDASPTVLSDGRVLFSSWQCHPARQWRRSGSGLGGPGGLGAAPSRPGAATLLTISWGGEDLNLFYPSHLKAPLAGMACETPDRAIIFVQSDGGEANQGGQLARVWLRRPLKTHEVISRGAGRYRHPHALPDGRLLVSHAADGKDYGLYVFDFEKRTVGAKVLDDPLWNDVDAIPVAPRKEPLGRITMVDDKASSTAILACIDVYETDRPEIQAIPRGSVRSVRFVEGIPQLASKVSPGQARDCRPCLRILGEAPVETDGSFLVEVPADTPFFIQTLDERGMALGTMPVWMGLRPRDERTCMGCHEDKEISPRNHVPQAILKGKPSKLKSSPAERRSADFARDVLPILERRCLGCHGDSSAGGVDLRATDVASREKCYELLRSHAVPGSARESAVVLRALGIQPSPGTCTLQDAGERKALVEWVDLGLEWLEASDLRLSNGTNSHGK